MKTSNKLLIGFALAVIILPLLGMAIVSRVYFEESSVYSDTVHTNSDATFASKSEAMVARTIAKPFSAVQIKDAKGYYVNIRLVEDKDYGIKINKNFPNGVSFDVDASGHLQLAVKDKIQGGMNSITVIVYSPKISSLSISKANDILLQAKLDTMNLQVDQSGNVGFESNTLIKNLVITTDKAESVYINEQAANALSLNLKDTNFNTIHCSYSNLNITSKGNALIEVLGTRQENVEKGNFTIDNLTFNTSDTADVKLENIKVAKASGTFSDQTKIQMPAATLNLIYKK